MSKNRAKQGQPYQPRPGSHLVMVLPARESGMPSDLTDRRCGRWTVLGPADRNDRGQRRWTVRCDCGSERVHTTGTLTTGRSKSCGCLQREAVSTRAGLGWISDVFRTYQKSAVRRDIGWSLTEAEVAEIITKPCHYCGAPPSNNKSPRRWASVRWSGIDRVDNDRDYEPENIVPCCGICNNAKRTLKVAEFLAWARRVAEHTGGVQ